MNQHFNKKNGPQHVAKKTTTCSTINNSAFFLLTVLWPFITGHLRKWFMSKDITYILIDTTTLWQEISHLPSRIGFRIIAGLHNTDVKKNMAVLLQGVKVTHVPTCWRSSVYRQQFIETREVEKATYSITSPFCLLDSAIPARKKFLPMFISLYACLTFYKFEGKFISSPNRHQSNWWHSQWNGNCFQ